MGVLYMGNLFIQEVLYVSIVFTFCDPQHQFMIISQALCIELPQQHHLKQQRTQSIMWDVRYMTKYTADHNTVSYNMGGIGDKGFPTGMT